MKKIFEISILLALVAVSVVAQNDAAAIKFDEIANVPNYYCPDCEPKVNERLDRFVNYLKNKGRGKQAFLIHYRSRILQETNKHRLGVWLNSAKWRLSALRIGDENVTVIYGGIREFDTLEFWIAPKGVAGPIPTPKYTIDEAIDCPYIYVYQSGFAFDRTVRFDTSISPNGNYGFEWSVDKGIIKTGDRNKSLEIYLDKEDGDRVTAFLKVSGLPIPCKNSFIADGNAGNTPRLVDEFGRAPDGDVKARLDAFFNVLINNPQMQGYVYLYGSRNESARDIRMNRTRISRSIFFRRYDPERIIFVEAGSRETISTEFWLVPQGVPPPDPTPSVDRQFVAPTTRAKRKTRS